MAQHLDEHDRPFLGEPLREESIGDRRPPGPGRTLVAVVLFALAFGLVSGGVRRLAGSASGSIMAAKLREVTDDPRGFDLAFIGNSHAYRGVDPQAFDAAMAEAGQSIRSYNLAAQAMTYPELEATLRRLIEERPPRLRWILVDLSFGWLTDVENFSTRRVVWWHDGRATWDAIRLVLASRRSFDEKIVRCVGHARDYFNRLTNRGLGVAFLEQVFSGTGGDSSLLTGHTRGFQALAEGVEEVLDRRRERFLSSVPQYLRTVWQLAKVHVRVTELDSLRGQLLERTIDRCRRHGLRLVFYMPPALTDRIPFVAQAGDGVPEPMRFNQPKGYPQLYHVASRFDASHLNGSGARLFARYLAGEFARLCALSDDGQAPGGGGDD